MGESMFIHAHWKTSMNVGALVTLIAGVHYFYMREYWITVGSSPIVYRYIDWTLTVPLQMIEFFLILSAANPNISGGMFWRLLIGTVVMLAFGYMGEERWINAWVGFVGAWPAGSSFWARSSPVRLARSPLPVFPSPWGLPSVPCASSSLSVGPSTPWVTSSVTSAVPSLPPHSTSSTTWRTS